MPRKTFFADFKAFQKALNTFKNIDHEHKTTQIDKEGTEHELTFEDLNGYTEFPFPDGTICLALVRMEAKFGPRYAAIAKGGFGRRPARGIRARLSACGVLPPSAGL